MPNGKPEEKQKTLAERVSAEFEEFATESMQVITGLGSIAGAYSLFGPVGGLASILFTEAGVVATQAAGKEYSTAQFMKEAVVGSAVFAPLTWYGLQAAPYLFPYIFPAIALGTLIYRNMISKEKIELEKLLSPLTYIPAAINPVYLGIGLVGVTLKLFSGITDALYALGQGFTAPSRAPAKG